MVALLDKEKRLQEEKLKLKEDKDKIYLEF